MVKPKIRLVGPSWTVMVMRSREGILERKFGGRGSNGRGISWTHVQTPEFQESGCLAGRGKTKELG